MFKHLALSLLLLGVLINASAQECILEGRVVNAINNESIPFVVAVLKDAKSAYPSTADTAGRFRISAPKPGFYNLEVIMSGFKTTFLYEIQLKPERVTRIEVKMEPDQKNLGEVTISAQLFVRKEESPLSMRSIGTAEIKRNPGGNRDISRIIQSLPGVASPPTFRNDIIVRGGSPNENRFYLDGIEIPNINHFATQGASGGPVGLLNVDFINEVDFYSGAFPANRGDALSSVMDIKFKEGRSDKTGASFALGATDLATTLEGPLSEKTTYIASYRRSYLQFLFAALDLPFLPTYNDFQFKVKYKPDNKQEVNVLALGAYDVVALNTSANETESQRYILGNIPQNSQWNYTVGTSYKRYSERSFTTYVLSRNHLNNEAVKYRNNDDSNESNKLLKYRSQEIENKIRVENTALRGSWKINTGINLQQSQYTNDTYNQIPFIGHVIYQSNLDFLLYGTFAQVSKTFGGAGLVLSLGTRFDGNTFGKAMKNPLEQFSPRFSLSKSLGERFSFNANTGIYYQRPAYTILGFRDSEGRLTNKGVKYIRSEHLVAGLEYQNKTNGRITVEGFYKRYSRYPLGLQDSVSIANQGSDFGIVGDEPVDSRSRGYSTGIEVLLQQKLFKGFYGILAYTIAQSKFTNFDDRLVASSWDYRHTLSMTAGKTFAKNWETGLRFRYSSGSPYTPYDVANSSLRSNWDISGQGVPDPDRINTLRNGDFAQLDIRVDKKYYYKKWTLDIYLDIQNLFNYQTELRPFLTVQRNPDGSPVVDPADSSRYLLTRLPNTNGTVIPTLGIIVEL